MYIICSKFQRKKVIFPINQKVNILKLSSPLCINECASFAVNFQEKKTTFPSDSKVCIFKAFISTVVVGTVVAGDTGRIAVGSPGVDMAAGSGRVLAL